MSVLTISAVPRSACWRTGPRTTRRSARSSWTAPWSPAICAAGRCARSPRTCARTGGPSWPTARRSAWSAASPWKGRKPASSARPRWRPGWSSSPRCARAAPLGRARARTGALTRDAARAATGRRMPEQRRRKAVAALAAIPPPLVAQANRDRATRHLAGGRRRAWPGSRDTPTSAPSCWPGSSEGASLAVISREAGLNKDWLSRHLGRVDPVAAEAARRRRPHRLDARWLPALHRLGFSDVPGYLRDRHIVQHWTVNAIAAEVGLTHHTVQGRAAPPRRDRGGPRGETARARASARRRSPAASASTPWPAMWPIAGRPAGPGGDGRRMRPAFVVAAAAGAARVPAPR